MFLCFLCFPVRTPCLQNTSGRLFLALGVKKVKRAIFVLKIYQVRRDQVNLLVYWPDRPYFSQKQKSNISYKILANWLFWDLLLSAFFKKKKEMKQNTYTNNQNQEAFIVLIINYKLRVFLLCLLCKILCLKKYRPEESSNIFILPTDRSYFFGCLARRPKN